MNKFTIMLMLLFSFFNEAFQEEYPDERIVGGRSATIQEFPFMAGIVVEEVEFQCGCSIISPFWIITAAHCIELLNMQQFSKQMIYISAGNTAWSQGNMHAVMDWAFHDGYDNNTYDNDIALIRVAIPFKGTLEKAISIATETYVYKPGKKITVIGWGVEEYGFENSTKELNAVDVNIIKQSDCASMYQTVNAKITDNMFCAGTEKGGKDACQFDSGGPIFDDSLLIGIVSWGEGCANKDKPGVYTRVTKYRKWITETTRKLEASFDTVVARTKTVRRAGTVAKSSSDNIVIGWVQRTIVFVLCILVVQ